jgi:hypothetical protein
MEKAAQKYRRTDRAPTLAEYNAIMKEGWQLFIDEEDTKLNSFQRNITTQSWEDCGLSPFNPFCINWNEAIASFGQLEQEVEVAFEIAPVENREKSHDDEEYEPTKILSLEEKATLRKGIPAPKLRGMNDFAVAVIRAKEILSQWRNEIKNAVGEGETAENARTIIQPTALTDPQKVAMLLVRFVPVDMSTIKTGETMTKEERQKEADAMTLTTTEVMQSVKLVFFDESGKPHPAASMRLNSENENGEHMWSVSVNGEDPKRIPESDLLKTEKYKIISAYQDPANMGILRNGRARMQKRNRVEKAMSEEKERSKKAVEKQDTAMYEDFAAINKAIGDGKFEFLMLKQIILKWKKPFQCQVDGVECIVGENDNPILQMKPVMVKELSENVLAKRAQDNDGDVSRPAKKKRNNAAVPTGFGEQGQTASYMVQSRDFEEQKKKDICLLKSKKKRKEAVEKTLLEYNKFHDKLRSDLIAWRREQEQQEKNKTINPESSSSQNDSSSSQLSLQKKKKKLLVRPRELWEVSELSTTADLDILARLFRLETYKFAANKAAKMSWIPRDRLNLHDVVRGYNSLQQESKELDAFLSEAASGTASDENNYVEFSNGIEEVTMLTLE